MDDFVSTRGDARFYSWQLVSGVGSMRPSNG